MRSATVPGHLDRLAVASLGALGLVHTRQIHRFPTGAAIARLTADLGLAPAGQDWELEAADARRVGEFLDRYDAGGLDDNERFALMSLIVASFDGSLATGRDKALQDRIVEHLSEGFDVLNALVQYLRYQTPGTRRRRRTASASPRSHGR